MGSPGSCRTRGDAAGLLDMRPRSQGWDKAPTQDVPARYRVQDRIDQVAFKANAHLFISNHPWMKDGVFGELTLTHGNST